MRICKWGFLFIILIQLALSGGCKILQPKTEQREAINSQQSSEVGASTPLPSDNKVITSTDSAVEQTDASSEFPKDADESTNSYLFDIYSDKDNLKEAAKEITLKHIKDLINIYNEDYIREGVDQRMEDARLASDNDFSCDRYDNLVEGGTLFVCPIEFELKPKYPEKFIPPWVLDTLQDNGWVYLEGRELLIYHENSKVDAPYYLARPILFDEFYMGKSAEQVLTEIVEKNIPKLKLKNYENFSYGDELTFYKNDESSNTNPTAISVVTRFLEAMRENDYGARQCTMTDETQKSIPSYDYNDNNELGVISLDILDIHYETDLKYKYTVVNCAEAVKKGLTADNIAIVYALFDVKYDHTKSVENDGKTQWHFTLIRKDNQSPWYIAAWGYGRRGI